MNKCIQVFLPALITNEEQRKMTDECRKSLISFENCLQFTEDNNKYPDAVAGAWNAFFNAMRSTDYEYLLITANDVLAHPNAIDYMVRYMNSNPETSILCTGLERDFETFQETYGQLEYSEELGDELETPCFMIRKGVIEEVGRINGNRYPIEFVERDYFYRAKLAGFKIEGLKSKLFYHPPESMTVGYDDSRFRKAFYKYIEQWGGDANKEKFKYPFNDMSYDYRYAE